MGLVFALHGCGVRGNENTICVYIVEGRGGDGGEGVDMLLCCLSESPTTTRKDCTMDVATYYGVPLWTTDQAQRKTKNNGAVLLVYMTKQDQDGTN